MRCKACNKMQTQSEIKLYDDLCRKCYEVSARPDDEHPDDTAHISILWDEGWEKDDKR